MPVITILRDASGNLVFDPPTVTLDPLGDFVSWANRDDQTEHQPTMQGKPKDYWLDDPIPRYEEGQPPATSPPVTLTPMPPNVASITYVDGLNPDAATGTITVPPTNEAGDADETQQP